MKIGFNKNEVVVEQDDLQNVEKVEDLIAILCNLETFSFKLLNYIIDKYPLSTDHINTLQTMADNLSVNYGSIQLKLNK